jgi:hypothetical protein
VPVENRGVGAVTLSHCRWVGFDPMSASSAPYDETGTGCGCAAEGCRPAWVSPHCGVISGKQARKNTRSVAVTAQPAASSFSPAPLSLAERKLAVRNTSSSKC